MLNILTIDIEDYFQVHAFSNIIPYEKWDSFECRVERNTDRILEMLDEHKPPIDHLQLQTHNSKLTTHHSTKGTFFVLGWIAERHPDLVRRIQNEGHEIACHGYAHRLVYNQTKEEFKIDIRKAKDVLEDITGEKVMGYRSPSYSITNNSQWAFEVLIEEGFKYDSSIFPIRHDFYGMPEAPRFPFIISLNTDQNVEFSVLNFKFDLEDQNSELTTQNSQLIINNSTINTHNSKRLIEFPISTVRILGQNIPISGGGYFRLFPYNFVKLGLKWVNAISRMPFIFYLHPWELDFEQPRIKCAQKLSKFRHYVNLDKTEIKLKKLLDDFQFIPIRDMIEENVNTPAL